MLDSTSSPSIYRPRSPRSSPLWQIVHHAWSNFLGDYESKYRKIHGPLRPFSTEAVNDFYQCGDLSAGFMRLLCPNPDCGHQRLLAFTCKSRHFCPACHQRRVCGTAHWIAETLCKPVPHRQFVFTMPRMLRGIFRKRRHLLDHLFKTATDSLRDWKHSGFNLDAGEKPVAADDVNGRRQLAEYLLRAPFSLQKITWNEKTATVIYRSGRNWKTKRNFEVFSATDFLAAAVEHIPDRYHHTIRYYGVYSNRSRGIEQRRNQASPSCQCAHPECAPPDPPSALSTVTHPQQPNRKLRPLWRDLIMRVWGEDPLLCPECKTTMKVVDKVLRPEEIEFFLKLHDLWEGLLAIPPPPDPPFDVETLEPIRTPPEFQWWKPEVSDPAQFELQVPHWSPDFEFQESQQAAQSGESATSWQAMELTLDTERTLVLDSDPPAQDEFTEFF